MKLWCNPKVGAVKSCHGGSSQNCRAGLTGTILMRGEELSSNPRGCWVRPCCYYSIRQLDISLPATPNSIRHVLIFIFTTAGKARGARIGCEYGKHKL